MRATRARSPTRILICCFLQFKHQDIRVYTQDPTVTAQEHEQLVHLPAGDDLKTYVIGPRNTRVKPFTDVTSEIRVRIDRAASKLVIDTGGTPSKIAVAEKTWGP